MSQQNISENESEIQRVLGSDTSKGAIEQLRILGDISQAFSRTVDIEETLASVVGQVTEYMNAEAASIFLLDQSSGQLVCRASAGPVDVKGLTISVSEGVVGRTVRDCSCQLIRDMHQHPDFSPSADENTGFVSRSSVCAPLMIGDGVIGAIQVLNKADGQLFDKADEDVLRVLATPTALAINNAKMAMDLVEQKRIKRELKLARSIQKSLFPNRQKPPFPIQGSNIPAREVSGDFYDFFELADGRIGFTIGDVSGKGVDASLLMVRTTSLLRWSGKQGLVPEEWMEGINRELCETISMGMFVCAVVGYYDPETGIASWSNAGFPPLLKHSGCGTFTEFHAPCPPMGILPQQEYMRESTSLDDAALYLYSDGVTESRTGTGSQLGVEGLRQGIMSMSDIAPERRLGQMVQQMRNMRIHDDTTILLIEDRLRWRKPLIRFGFRADPCNLSMLRENVAGILDTCVDERELRDHILLVLNEASSNIFRHGYGGDPEGQIEFSLSREGNCLIFTLRDYAETINKRQIKPRDLSDCRPGGLGINFMDSVMDHWEFTAPIEGKGNLLVMKKHIGQGCKK